MRARVLLVEDDRGLARVLRDNLSAVGFDVDWAETGRSAVAKARAVAPDLIVLDIMLPDGSGFDLVDLLKRGRQTPIVFLTARGQRADKLRGLNLGADDYVTKPFDLEELLARLNAVLRRSRPVTEGLTLGDLVIDFRARTVSGSREVHLTDQEFELLRYLADHADRIVDRQELLSRVWGYPAAPDTRSVDQAILRLRKKIEIDPHHPRFIHTVHGDGYRLTSDASRHIESRPARQS
jgi:DNA-binding response OmpR family regulator